MCIDTTVRAAKDHKIPVTIIKDACATKDLSFGEKLSANEVSNVYFASLNNMFAEIISIDELCKCCLVLLVSRSVTLIVYLIHKFKIGIF